MRKYLLLAALGTGLLATSCKPDDPTTTVPPAVQDSKVAFTVNGGPFNNYRVQMNDVSAQEGAAYEPSSGYLAPLVFGGTKDGKYDVEISAQWKVNGPKTIFFNDDNTMNISLDDGDTTAVSLTSKTNEGTVVISKFGEVGSTIEGTFKGTFTSSGGGDISVTDGKFNLKRDEDL
jgi:hypothetical protein